MEQISQAKLPARSQESSEISEEIWSDITISGSTMSGITTSGGSMSGITTSSGTMSGSTVYGRVSAGGSLQVRHLLSSMSSMRFMCKQVKHLSLACKMALGGSLLLAILNQAQAITYEVNPDTKIVGDDTTYTIERSGTTTLEYVASHYQLGLSNLIEANPGVDPIVPINGTSLIIPRQLILPATKHEGIIVNSPEMRLYYYHDGKVDILPIGIGQLGTDTPLNWVTKVERKRANPTWTPTAKMHAEYAARGEFLPKVWPAGPDNPMGLFAIYIGRLYAIHGTNADFGIGLRVSHGCVRLRNSDIEYLFNQVPVGTRVQFINEPIKTTQDANGNLYIEVHQPLSMSEEEFDTLDKDLPFNFTKEQQEFFKNPAINQEVLSQALSERSGRVVLLNPVTF